MAQTFEKKMLAAAEKAGVKVTFSKGPPEEDGLAEPELPEEDALAEREKTTGEIVLLTEE